MSVLKANIFFISRNIADLMGADRYFPAPIYVEPFEFFFYHAANIKTSGVQRRLTLEALAA